MLQKGMRFTGKRGQTKTDGRHKEVLWLLWRVSAAKVDEEET